MKTGCDYCLKRVPTGMSAVAVVARMNLATGNRRVVRRRMNFCDSREAALWVVNSDHPKAVDRFIRWAR